jgi:tRNA/rRNA methyltransferase
VGFTARERHRRRIRTLRGFAAHWVQGAVESSSPPQTALVFGSERDGLSNRELDHCTELVWIPADPSHPSYNLAQAVLLCGYELLCARIEMDERMPPLHPRRTRPPRPSKLAEADQLEALLRHLRAAFLAIGYAQPHTVDPLVRSYHEMFSRARLHRREANMLRGLAHQMLWAARQIGSMGAGGSRVDDDPEA